MIAIGGKVTAFKFVKKKKKKHSFLQLICFNAHSEPSYSSETETNLEPPILPSSFVYMLENPNPLPLT